MNQTDKLGDEKIFKLLMSYSLPGIVGLFVGASYNIIDRIFIGNGTGSLGIAGVAVVYPIMMIIMAFSTLIGMGATALVSIRLGEKKIDEAERILGNALALLIIISAILIIPGFIFLNPILRAFGASDEVLPYARDYSSIILPACIFLLASAGMNNLIRAEGHPQKSMIALLTGSVLNVILAPIFIFGFHWGIKGAALATAIAQAISASWVLSHFFLGKSVLKIHIKNMKLDRVIVGKILSVGAGPFIIQFMSSAIYAVMNQSLAQYGGDTAISGMGIVITVQTFIMLPVWGISLGIQPIIGFNYGAKKYDRVKDILKASIIFATIIASAAFIMMYLFPQQIIAIFNRQDKELIAFGSHAMLTFLMFIPVLGIQMIGSGYFQAIGRPKQAILLSLTRQGLILIPALLILPNFLQMQGILISGPISDAISTLIVVTVLLLNLRGFTNGKANERETVDIPNN